MSAFFETDAAGSAIKTRSSATGRLSIGSGSAPMNKISRLASRREIRVLEPENCSNFFERFATSAVMRLKPLAKADAASRVG
jgi:hypothetical protein